MSNVVELKPRPAKSPIGEKTYAVPYVISLWEDHTIFVDATSKDDAHNKVLEIWETEGFDFSCHSPDEIEINAKNIEEMEEPE